ncbi:MAG: tRNA preQ1(34) S-adenosylmethionine ribosyltransferase-isomerase QueA [Candidatus Altimarinota bacterium]
MDFLSEYDYRLPTELVALEPVSPRDSSRLMVYDTQSDSIQFDIFAHIDQYIPSNSSLVLNQTQVVPSRLRLKKEKGKPTDLLFLFNEPQQYPGLFKVISSRHLPVGQKLWFDDDHLLTIEKQDERFFYVKPHFPEAILMQIIDVHGRMPLPHYLEATSLEEQQLRDRYQTVFASQPGSIAAPTASLHFTPELLKRLEVHREILKITHHVGLATFTTVLPENVKEGRLLEEWYEIEDVVRTKIQNSKFKTQNSSEERLVAVGTTAVRALESFARSGEVRGKTDLFIMPPYEFQVVDALVTNFHLPKTSLMMLVQAFLQYKGAKRSLVELYEMAVRERFRFYSFGDAMLIL